MKDISAKYEQVKSGYKSQIMLDVEFRKEQLRNLYYSILDNEEILKTSLYTDFHRPPAETEMLELNGLISEVLLAIQSLDEWSRDKKIDADVRFMFGKNIIRKEPYGIVLVIGPWNYPLLCTLGPVISALAAGNTVVVKPTEVAAESALAIKHVISTALDPRVAQVVLGGVEETTELLKLKFDKIMFTGSNRVGNIVLRAAAQQEVPTPVALELGGKSPVVVYKSANLKLAAKRLAWAKFANAGQTCIAPDYCLVDHKIAPLLANEIQLAAAQLYPDMASKGGDNPDFSHIVSDRMFNRLNGLVKKSAGNIWQLGKPNASNRFFPPTVVTDVTLSDSLMTEELFGPILPIISVDEENMADVISDVVCGHGHDYPLATYIFSNEQKEIDAVLRTVRSGAVMVNDAVQQGGSAGIPFGGVGNSGMGRYHGKWGFDEFTHEKPVIYQPSLVESLINSRYPPFSNLKSMVIKSVSRPLTLGIPRKGRVRPAFWLRVVKRVFSKWTLLLIVVYLYGLRSLN